MPLGRQNSPLNLITSMKINNEEINGEVVDWDSYYKEVEKISLSSDNPDEWVAKEKEYEKDFILIKIRKEVD